MKYITVVLTLVLTACGQPSKSTSGSAQSTKPVFSVWRLADGRALDLRGLAFGRVSATLPVAQGSLRFTCQLIADTSGDQARGTVQVVSSTPLGLTSGQYTTACSEMVAIYDFERNSLGMAIAQRGAAPLQYF